MSKKFLDLSVSLEEGIKSDPDFMLPKINYHHHKETAEEMMSFFPGLKKTDLPGEEGWAMETITVSTHNGTHMDAPYHYHSTMNNGQRAITIDEVPLEWCFSDGVKLDLRSYEDGYVLTRSDLHMNKNGRVVSKKKHQTAKAEKRLEKAGYFTRKGKFGFVRKDGKGTKKRRSRRR